MSCSCTTTTATTTCADACACTTDTTVAPLTIAPVTSSQTADDKWSVQTTVKARGGSGAQTSKYTGQATGATTQDKVNDIHTELTDIATDLIRGVIGETYTGPQPFSPTLLYNDTAGGGGTDVAILTNVVAFQNYFLNSQPAAGNPLTTEVEVTAASDVAYVNYIAQSLYQVYQSVQRHIEGADTTFVVCPSGSSRLLKVDIDNCLFCTQLIYN